MKAASGFLMERGQAGRLTHVIAEARGAKEDTDLELEFRRVMDSAPAFGAAATPMEIRVISKQANSEGLQLADLLAHPIGRHVLKPEQANRAFDIIRLKLLRDGTGTHDGTGLIIHP